MRTRDDRGSTIVEYALVFPIVLLVVLGIIQYGYHYWALETSAASAREAARLLIVGNDPACTRDRALEAAAAPHVGSGTPTVTFAYGSPPSTGNPAVRGTLVTVTVTIQSLDLGILPVPDDGRITQTATNRVEGHIPLDSLDCE